MASSVTRGELALVEMIWPKRTRFRSASDESIDGNFRALMASPSGPEVVA
jgi:hypothetical protein